MGIEVPILPLAVGTALKALRFACINVSNLGSGLGPQALVPPGADSSKVKATQLAILQALQSGEFAAGNMSVSDSVALAKTEGYLAEDFTEGEVQIKAFTPVLASAIGTDHPLVTEYITSRDYIESNKIRFYKALTKSCGQKQAPVMLVYLFQHLVIGFFLEQATSQTLITPHLLHTDLCTWKMGGSMYWLPSVDRVLCIDTLSQQSHYVRVNEGACGGGGGGNGKLSVATRNKKVTNQNLDPRFKSTTALGSKIRKMKMTEIMKKANFDNALCTPCDDQKRERCLTFHGKGSCFKECRFAYDHVKLPDSAVAEMYTYISDGCI